jgi:hypothetical protein
MNFSIGLLVFIISTGFAVFNLTKSGKDTTYTEQLIKKLMISIKIAFFLFVVSIIQSIFHLWILDYVLVAVGAYFLFLIFKIILEFEKLIKQELNQYKW